MNDYEPLDLAAYLDARPDVIDGAIDYQFGDIRMRGIPFSMGSRSGAPEAFIGFGPDLRADPLRIPIDRAARSIIVAHVALDSAIARNGPIGEAIAEYVFELDDGSELTVPIRELLEIGGVTSRDPDPTDVRASRLQAWPFLAYPDRYESLHPRRGGDWRFAGRRLEEAGPRTVDGFGLWVWRNPTERRVMGLRVEPRARRFVIAAVTIGLIDEDPFVRTGREPIRIELPGTGLEADEHLVVSVDRGVATYAWPVLRGTAGFLDADVQGWGDAAERRPRTFYAEVAATPSATVTVSSGTDELGSARWTDILEGRASTDPGAVRIGWVDRSRTWVHTTVVDAESGRPIPCRIHFRSPAGIPYAPHGHHAHPNADIPSWHMDVGGDVRLGETSYAVIDGRCQGWLPVGDVLVEVNRGFEYAPLRQQVRILPGQRELSLEMRRWSDLRSAGWLSGDTHVHFLSVDGAHLEAAAEDLDVVNLLQAQWGHLFTNTEDFTGRPSVSEGLGTTVFVGQENRQHVLGHMGLLGLRQPVMPWSSDGPGEGEVGGTLEATLAEWADQGHAQGALVTLPHFGYPNGEAAALIATGRVDAVEMIWQGEYFHREYYRYLNAGYQVPLVAGTDKMTSEVPVGIYRTYVHLLPDEEPSFESWTRNVIRGRTFASAGPIVTIEVDGREPGDTLRLGVDGGTLDVIAIAESAAPIHSLQLVAAGEVIAETTDAAGTHRLELRERIRIDRTTWLAARTGGPSYYDARRTLCSFERGVFAHTSPVYVACGPGAWEMSDPETLDYLVARVEAARAYVRDIAPRTRLGGGGHPHAEADHLAHLERPFLEALTRLAARRRA